MKKTLPLIIGIAFVVGAGGFFGGVQYQKSKSPVLPGRGGLSGFQQMTEAEREQARAQFGGAGSGLGGVRNGGRAGGAGAVAGEILSKDEKSITLKLPDGGSKIIFFSESADIGKFTSGSGEDLMVGETVMVNGTANTDGSITAQNIQIRPLSFSTRGE